MDLICGNSLEILKSYPNNFFDSVVCDPPYGLVSIVRRFGKKGSADCKEGSDGRFKRLSKGFMNQEWDGSGIEKSIEFWEEVYRVLKPGAHLLAFGGTRTIHRITCTIEDAGFEIRDSIYWAYLQGFPKSHDVAKDIDRIETGVTRGKRGETLSENISMLGKNFGRTPKGNPITEDAKEWEGWGTSLKPSVEPICLARKPISEKNVALNILKMIHRIKKSNLTDYLQTFFNK